MKTTYAEPTTLWRLQRREGSVARALILPNGFGCTLVWWVDEQVRGAQEFPDWESALTAADKFRLEMEGGGWTAV